MAIVPFHFRLQKVSSHQQRLLDALLSFLPNTGLRARFGRSIDEALEKHLCEKVAWRLESVNETTLGSFARAMQSDHVVSMLSCVPANREAYLQIDNILAQAVIGRLIGEGSDVERVSRKLSDTEHGILEYLLLQLMSHIHRICGTSSRVQFRFAKFLGDIREIEKQPHANDPVTVLTVRVEIGSDLGFVKLVFPNPLVEAAFLNVQSPAEFREEEFEYELNELKRFDNFKTTMWAEAGRTTLMPKELMQLEREDVVLFDETDILLGPEGNANGRAPVHVGSGEHGGFLAEISSEGRVIHARLMQLLKA